MDCSKKMFFFFNKDPTIKALIKCNQSALKVLLFWIKCSKILMIENILIVSFLYLHFYKSLSDVLHRLSIMLQPNKSFN